MDHKQFERLQTAVQTVVDEARSATEMPTETKTAWTWDQTSWGWGQLTDEVLLDEASYAWHAVCGTGGCLAGTIVYQNGDRFLGAVEKTEKADAGSTVAVEMCIDEDNKVHNIATRARQLIGLGDLESATLFAGRNTADMIATLATLYSATEGYQLEVV